jgi:hypothetical protein
VASHSNGLPANAQFLAGRDSLFGDSLGEARAVVCTENLVRFDDVIDPTVLAEMAGLFFKEPPPERVYGVVSLEGLPMEAPRGHPSSSDRPEGRLGEYLFDVPVAPHGELKATLRAACASLPTVRTATLLEVQGGEFGDVPCLTVVIADNVNPTTTITLLRSASERLSVALVPDDHVVAAYASARALPFYVRDVVPLPQRLEDRELLARLAELPDETSLHPMFADYPGLFKSKRNESHRAAKRLLGAAIENHTPFSLLLRTFGVEAVHGPSQLLADEQMWSISVSRPLERAISEITPLDLVAIANPRDPLGSPHSHQLQLDDRWFGIAVELVRRAAAIFVICDSVTSGIEQEFQAIQQMGREDDCLILLPGRDQAKYYEQIHFGIERSNEMPSYDAARFRRRLATFGVTTTSEEFLANHQRFRLDHGRRS